MSEVDTSFISSSDEAFMRRAIALAWRGAGWTNPNPLVGAVIVKDGAVLGEGYHERYGEAHAERNALANCAARGMDPTGATIYVTLEPCCHQGKQPPCTQALVQAGIARVLVGSRDPNPLVSGKGNALLREAGIEVVEDVLRDECDVLNPIFFHFIQAKRPYVVAKWAMTLDGKIATRTGDACWVSGEESRADVHDLRHRLAAIMVGRGTVQLDDPSLTARRNQPSNQPLRIVLDSHLSISLDSQLVKTARDVPVMVATAEGPDADAARKLRDRGVEVLSLPAANGQVDLVALMDELGARGVDSILVEGGGVVHEALFKAGLVNRVIVYAAPKVVGGAQAKTPVEGEGVDLMAQAYRLGAPSVARCGCDLRLVYECDGGASGAGAGTHDASDAKAADPQACGSSASSAAAGAEAGRQNRPNVPGPLYLETHCQPCGGLLTGLSDPTGKGTVEMAGER